MATLHPPLSTFHPTSAGAYRERDILSLLEQGLPESFDVFHSVDWAAMHGDDQSFGELDAVVVAPSGHVMLLEVKAGSVSVSGNALVKTYSNAGGTKIEDIGHQSRRQHGAMLDRLSDEGLSAVYLGHLLVLADHTVEGGTVAYPRERIVDASQLDSLCSQIKTALQKEALPQTTRTRVMDFWANRFDVHPDASTQMGQVQKANITLAEGLATWVPRISHSGGAYFQSGSNNSCLNRFKCMVSESNTIQERLNIGTHPDEHPSIAVATKEIPPQERRCKAKRLGAHALRSSHQFV